jgi:S1-C subfamily serine protease
MTTYQTYPPPRRSSAMPLVLAGAAFALATWVFVERSGVLAPAPAGDPRPVAARGELAPMEQTFIRIFEQASPSVAHITTQSLVRDGYFLTQQKGTGSGFVWDDRGTVITNYHVVAGAREVKVAIGNRVFTADVLTGSPDHDLAILRLRGNVTGLAPLPLGTSADLKVGQTVLAIGNPFGFDQTLTTGVVSALNRTVPTDRGTQLASLIQVDAAINPGNSGGPLLDSAGRLVGVTTAIYSPSGASAGIGFAVPVDTVNEVVPRLIAGRRLTPVLGIRNPTPYRSAPVEVGGQYRRGALFTEVAPGLGAATAGLQPTEIDEGQQVVRRWGDLIVGIGDTAVRSFDEIGTALRNRAPGQSVSVTLVRGLPDRPRVETVTVELKGGDG